MGEKPKVVAIMGPTAAGKTALAVEAVQRFPAQIISVDSAQVYRRLDLGSAKPNVEEQICAPHRLIDIREPWQPYSVADFVADARVAIDAIVDQRLSLYTSPSPRDLSTSRMPSSA